MENMLSSLTWNKIYQYMFNVDNIRQSFYYILLYLHFRKKKTTTTKTNQKQKKRSKQLSVFGQERERKKDNAFDPKKIK